MQMKHMNCCTMSLQPDKYDKMDIILEKLRDYTVKHFADEEQYMESIHYKKMFTQKVQHMELYKSWMSSLSITVMRR